MKCRVYGKLFFCFNEKELIGLLWSPCGDGFTWMTLSLQKFAPEFSSPHIFSGSSRRAASSVPRKRFLENVGECGRSATVSTISHRREPICQPGGD